MSSRYAMLYLERHTATGDQYILEDRKGWDDAKIFKRDGGINLSGIDLIYLDLEDKAGVQHGSIHSISGICHHSGHLRMTGQI